MKRWISIGVLLALFIGCDREKKVAADRNMPVELALGSQSRGSGGGGVQLKDNGDGRTVASSVGGSDCRMCKSGAGAHAYIYFAIDPKVKSPELKTGTVAVEYFDSGKGQLHMQYDGSNVGDDGHGAYSGSAVVEKMDGAQVWKTAVFPFHDAVFKNRQNGRSDFRIEAKHADLYIRKVKLVRG